MSQVQLFSHPDLGELKATIKNGEPWFLAGDVCRVLGIKDSAKAVRDIEAKLGGAEVIDPLKLPQEGRVVFGVTVVIENLDTEEQKRYKIVGDDEADFKANKISINSPIARGLIGKSEGDEAKIQTPSGEVEYEIVEVLYQ